MYSIPIIGWALLIALGSVGPLTYLLVATIEFSEEVVSVPRKVIRLTLCLGLVAFSSIFGGLQIANAVNQTFHEYQFDIVTLEEAGGVKGSWLHVESTQEYLVYHETEYGYKLEKFDSRGTYIKEDDRRRPCVIKWKEPGTLEYHYTIYCPNGTIEKYIYSI